MIFRNVSLKTFNTFGLDYKADCMIHIRTEKEAITLFKGKTDWKKPLLILGSGSNILFTSDFKGTIIYPEFDGIKVEDQDRVKVIISVGAGVNWDDLVEWTVNNGFGGLENLSLIPGKVGATPVQNIGAYGVEVKDTIDKVRTVSMN
jgi:UDP-N-acetylmuramate dehydrogenase